MLVVEVVSPGTRQRDFGVKRNVYIGEAAIPEYWVVDGAKRTFTIIRSGEPDRVVTDHFAWYPVGARRPLQVTVQQTFQ